MTTLPSFDAFLRSASHFPAALPPSPLRLYQCNKVTSSRSPTDEWSRTHHTSKVSELYCEHPSPTSSASIPSSWVSNSTFSDQDIAPITTPSSPTRDSRHKTRCIKTKRAKKKYLIEHQRCEIVCRVRQGEKQAHLAKEYGVSRAAVCYLLKHENEILQRWTIRRQHGPSFSSSSSLLFTSV